MSKTTFTFPEDDDRYREKLKAAKAANQQAFSNAQAQMNSAGWWPNQYIPRAPTYVYTNPPPVVEDYANEVDVESGTHDVTLTFKRGSKVIKRVTLPKSLWKQMAKEFKA